MCIRDSHVAIESSGATRGSMLPFFSSKKNFFIIGSMPVSYTHLDVYKRQALSRLIKNKTVLIIAHRMRTVAGADQVVVLSGGIVAEQGSPAELYARKGLYAHMVDPVSYTHLDVYKRQLNNNGNASLAATNSNNTTGNRNWNGSAGVADLSITPYIIYCTV